MNRTETSGSNETPRPHAAGSAALAALRVLVVGLGRFGGGVGVTRWLACQGADVTVTDQAGAETLADSIRAVADLSVRLHLGRHSLDDLDAVDLVVINPAVDKARSELFQAVVRRRIPWTTEMNLFCERCPAAVIGVTGSYGKSTTCAMLAGAMEAGGRAGGSAFTGVHLGGNIGGSLLTELDAIRGTDLVVLEMSNAQLEDLPRIDWAPQTAVICNLYPHHLDRHGGFAEYVAVKLNIIGPSDRTHRVIVGRLDPNVEAALRDRLANAPDRLVRVCRPEPPPVLSVPGDHNRLNAACVLTVCGELGMDDTAAREALRSFRGLPHRLEHVRTLDGVDYYNDSKSTSPVATVKAVEALARPIVVIVGGKDKGVSLAPCGEVLARACRCVIGIGECGPAFARAVRDASVRGDRADVREVDHLADAVITARAEARPGDAVLFSPGAPSFDAYANFEHRGRHFVELVQALS